jgi:methionyl-tRNA formyltransferase
MQNQNTFNSVIIGEESLLVRCGEILLNRGHQIQAVVTANRDIAQWASGHQIPTIAPVSGWADQVTAQPFDYLFSIANLSIIPDAVITHPTKQAINFHDGPLPKYAGLYATTWALLNGEDRHGITWHEMTSKVDEGRILKQRTFPLDDHESAQTLNVKCYDMATATFGELVDELATGRVSYIEQDLSQKSYFGRYKRPEATAIIRWNQRAAEIIDLVHALDFGPYPNPLNLPKLIVGDQVFAVTKASEGDAANGALHGTVVAVNAAGLTVAAADHYVVIEALTTLNGQPVALQDLNISEGERLTTLNAASAESFSQINDQLVRHERYWANLLRSLASVDVPYAEHTANTGAMGYRQHVLNLTDLPADNPRDYLFASFAAYLARLTNSAEFDLGFSDLALRALVNGPAKPFFSQQVPFRVRLNLNDGSVAANVAGLTEQVQHTREKLSYNRDLIARSPDLRARYDNTGVVFPVLLEETDDADNYTPPQGSELIFLVGQNGGHHLIYDPAVYANDKIQRMAQQYQTFLSNLTANPDQALADVSLLASDEYHKIVMDWNATQTDYDRTACVHDQFAAQAAQTPDAVAVVFEDQQLTYRDLNNSANQLGRYLQSLGVGPDVLVGVSVEPSLDMLVSIMGVHKAGGGYVPMDPSYPADRIALMLEDSHVSVLITQEHLLGRLPELPEHVVCIDRDWPQIAQQDTSDFKNDATPENLAYVIYTSGSTGRPKGVMVQHGNVVNFFAGLDQRIDYVPGDTWLAVTSLSFDISVLELFWTLTRGFKVVLYADSRKVSSTGQTVSKYAEKKIDFSLFYFASDEGEGVADKYHLLLEGAKFADTHGFDAVWTPERHFHAFGGLYPNPSVASAAIAAITQNIKIRA